MNMNLGMVSNMAHRNHLAMMSVQGDLQWILTTMTQNKVLIMAIRRLKTEIFKSYIEILSLLTIFEYILKIEKKTFLIFFIENLIKRFLDNYDVSIDIYRFEILKYLLHFSRSALKASFLYKIQK